YRKEARHAFIKDVIAMANTPRATSAHILLGVKYKAGSNKKPELLGLTHQVDDTYYHGLLGVDCVHPLPTIQYIPVHHEGTDFGILEIAVSADGPFLPLKKLG